MARPVIEYRSTAKEVYRRFCWENREIHISFEDWKAVVYAFNRAFRDHILETGERVKMPRGLGTFSISKSKPKKTKIYKGVEYINMPIDWPKTKKLGKRVYIMNAHTDGNRYKWMWFPSDANFYMANLWVFKPHKHTSAKLSEYLTKPDANYFQIYRSWHVRKK